MDETNDSKAYFDSLSDQLKKELNLDDAASRAAFKTRIDALDPNLWSLIQTVVAAYAVSRASMQADGQNGNLSFLSEPLKSANGRLAERIERIKERRMVSMRHIN